MPKRELSPAQLQQRRNAAKNAGRPAFMESVRRANLRMEEAQARRTGPGRPRKPQEV